MPKHTGAASPLITLEDAAFAYEGAAVLEGLNFSVARGDYLCIVGENGTGKSTLMKGLLRLKAPSHGKITYGPALKQNMIGYLPQQTDFQRDFPASVFEVVLSGRLNHCGARPFYNRADKAAAHEKIALLGMGDKMHVSFQALSGGQRQRVLLARALCATDTLLLLDEPVAGLDPLVTNELYKVIAKINRDTGVTVIMVSHDVRGALRYATHALHLEHRQVFFGDVAAYRKTPEARRLLEGCEDVDP